MNKNLLGAVLSLSMTAIVIIICLTFKWDDTMPEGGYIKGTGTDNDPYVIDTVEAFLQFTDEMLDGETYRDKHFIQTCDIDLTKEYDYTGVGSNQSFAGIYDGQGHYITANIYTSSDYCVFPYVEGTIINLGTRGFIANTGKTDRNYSAGIARSVRPEGKIVNCHSEMELDGYICAGIAATNFGLIKNCLFTGSAYGRCFDRAIAADYDEWCVFDNTYYLDECESEQDAEGVAKCDSVYDAEWYLNDSRKWVAKDMNMDIEDIYYFVVDDVTGKIALSKETDEVYE